MKLSFALSTLLILFAGCSSENKELKKKIEELEKDISYKEEKIESLYDNLISLCTSSREEVTSFGPYTLTEQVIYETDWDCASKIIVQSAYIEEGVKSAIIRSPSEILYEHYGDLTVHDDGDFFHVSGYSGGAHCCSFDLLLSKETPYEIMFSVSSDGDLGSLVSDFDDDGNQEIQISDKVLWYWKGPPAFTARVEIYLEFTSNGFKLDKDLIYSKVSEKIKNTEYEIIQFIPIEEENRNDPDGWEGYWIPRELTSITAALLFSGRETEAREFLDYVWPKDLPNKDLYWEEFKEELTTSEFWEY